MAKHIDDLSIIKHGTEVLNISFQVRKKLINQINQLKSNRPFALVDHVINFQ